MYERRQYGCSNVTKATHGAITREKHSRKEAQTGLLCGFIAPPELFVYRKPKKIENRGRLFSTAKVVRFSFCICTTNSKGTMKPYSTMVGVVMLQMVVVVHS